MEEFPRMASDATAVWVSSVNQERKRSLKEWLSVEWRVWVKGWLRAAFGICLAVLIGAAVTPVSASRVLALVAGGAAFFLARRDGATSKSVLALWTPQLLGSPYPCTPEP